MDGERDLRGYGQEVPRVEWPGGAKIAISLVINYEEGSERTPLNGDTTHEMIGDLPSSRPQGMRDHQIETQWDYGARAGIWRLLRLIEDAGVDFSLFACGLALERNPAVAAYIVERNVDVVSHGYRWLDQWNMSPETEADYIQRSSDSILKTTGIRPKGWYTKNGRTDHTRGFLRESGFVYDSDGMDDDLPYYVPLDGEPWLVVPYSLDSNDGLYWRDGWQDADQFFSYLRDSFDILYGEGAVAPRLLNVGLHSRVSGRPGRAAAVRRFLEYAGNHNGVWFAGRDQIADWWLEHYPAQKLLESQS